MKNRLIIVTFWTICFLFNLIFAATHHIRNNPRHVLATKLRAGGPTSTVLREKRGVEGGDVDQRVDAGSPEIHPLSSVKRSTMLLNKLMHALHKALDSEKNISGSDPEPAALISLPDLEALQQMDMQRRTGEGKMFWRCYFNAVSCF